MSEGEYICETCGRGFDSGGRLGVHVVRTHSESSLGSPIPKEELLQSIRALADELGKAPTAKEMAKHGEYSHRVCSNKFGSWNAALRAAGYDPQKRSKILESKLLEEIERLAGIYGRPPSSSEMSEDGKFCRDAFFSRFGNWEKALNRAGYTKPQSYGETLGAFPYGSNWHEQRERALERDNYQCQIPTCSVSRDEHIRRHASDLHVHHVTPRRHFVDENGDLDEERANDLDNLLTLCAPHHQYWESITPLQPDIR